jgi:hypothetical protein
MLATIVLFTALGGRSLPAPVVAASPYDRPRVEVWTNRGDNPFHTGEDARVYLRADRDAYVALFRVDTDGRVRVLFPRDPWDDGLVQAGREFEVEGGHGYDAFEIDDYPGVGYVFAVASADRFDFDAITRGDHWDYRVIADGRVRGDPYVALTDLAERIVPPGYDDWDYDITPYYVERHYDYPRFLCYDCHSYATFSYWNPYAYSCVRFRIVVFDDPYYYPYRYYGGRRVVFTRPLRPQPRFIFKDRGGVGDDRFVTRERERPVNDNGRRGVRGVDLGGRGSIPVPDVSRRRAGDVGRQNDAARVPERPRSADPTVRGDDRRDENRRDVQPRREVPSQRPETRDQPDRGRPDQRPQTGEERRGPAADRPTPPSRQGGQWSDRGQDSRGTPREAQPRRPQAEPRSQPARPQAEPRSQPPRASGGRRAEPRGGGEAAPSRGKTSSKPELRRRRP